jgi:hypothetical protein
MNGRIHYVFTRNTRRILYIFGICTGYSATKVNELHFTGDRKGADGTGYRFKSFDAARAMASANPNEVSWPHLEIYTSADIRTSNHQRNWKRKTEQQRVPNFKNSSGVETHGTWRQLRN